MSVEYALVERKAIVFIAMVASVFTAVLLLSGLPLQAGTSDEAKLTVAEDFEAGNLEMLRCSGNCPTLTSSNRAGGNHAASFHLNRDRKYNFRTEAVLTNGSGHFDLGQEYWIGLDYYFKDWNNDSNPESAPLQVHTTPGDWSKECGLGSARSSAPFFVSTVDSQLRFSTYGGKTLWQGPIEQQLWSRIVINFRVSSSSDGFVEAWIDGERLGRVDGPNTPRNDRCGNAMRAPYLKMGVYKWDWKRKETDTSRREVLVDNLMIAKGSDGFAVVSPNDNQPPIRVTTVPASTTTVTKDPNPTTTSSPVTTVPTSDGSLVAHYDFNNISGGVVADLAGGGHDGIVSGPINTSGKLGDALQFDGVDDYVDLGTFDVAGPGITLSAWIKADDFGVPDGRIISKSTGLPTQAHSWMMSTTEDNGTKLRFRLKTLKRTTTLTSTSKLPVGKWTLVTATYDGHRMRLYINGDESGSVKKRGSIANDPSVGVHVGDNPVTGQRAFDGAIDDLRIYSRSLSSSEIETLLGSIPPSTTTTSSAPLTTTTSSTSTTSSVRPTTTAGTNPPNDKHLIFEDGFETGYDKWNAVPADARLTDNSREGRKAVHIFGTPGAKRSELVSGGTSYDWNKEYWVGFSLNVPVVPTGYRVVSQHHAVPHTDPSTGKTDWSCTSGPNSFTVKIIDGEFEVRTTTIASNVNVTPPIGSATWGTKAVKAPFQLNKWHDFVLHFRYAPNNNGFMEVWIDGKKVVNVHNSPTVYNKDLCGKQRTERQYQKIGLYHGYKDPGGEVIYDSFRVGNGNASYSDVAPR